MTVIYFIRHAEPNYDNHNDMERELSPKGLRDRMLAAQLLADVPVDAVLSSPFKRAVDTVQPIADGRGLTVTTVDGFRERRVDSVWIEDFNGFCKAQWADFDYKLSDGECLREVQERNIAALSEVLRQYQGRTLVIGSHGTALSTIINHYDHSFGHEQFERIRKVMPWVVRFEFDGERCVDIRQCELPADNDSRT